jgi:putative MATE family efflux protein
MTGGCMENKRAKLLGETKIETALIKMTVPAIIGMMVNAIYNIVDAVYIGMLGTVRQAATNIVFPLFMIIGAVGLTFGIGAASYISRLLGQKNTDEANKTASTALFSSLIAGIVCTVLGLIYMREILIQFGATETNIEYAIKYARILTLGSIFTMLNMTMNNMLRAEGSSRISMIALTIGAVINIILDPIFIFVFNQGITGAAIATILSQLISTIILLSYYLIGKSVLKISYRFITISTKIYVEIMKIGLPTFIRQILASLAIALTNTAARVYGDPAIAGIGIINRVFMVVFYFIIGFNQGFQPIAGFSYGAKNIQRLKDCIKVSIRWTTIYCIIMTILFYVFAEPIVRLFSDDGEVIIIGIKTLYALCIMLPFTGIIIIFSGLFQAMGHGIKASILSLSRQGIFLIPALFILPKYYKLNGIIFAQPLADLCTLAVIFIISIDIIKEIYFNKNNNKSALFSSRKEGLQNN